MRKKLGFALGAGGSRGIAHIGFLQAMEEADICPDYLTGCSMGAMVGACYSAGASLETLKNFVFELKMSDITSLNFAPIRNNGLFRTNKIREMLEGLMGDKSFDELKIPFATIAADIISGKVITLDHGNVIDAAIASGSIPGVFVPTERDGMVLVDGNVLERVPVKAVKKMGAEVVVAVDVLGEIETRERPQNLIETSLRCIEIVDIANTRRKKRSKKVDLWLEPDLGNMDQFKVKDLKFAYEKGYELGKENVEKIKKLIEA